MRQKYVIGNWKMHGQQAFVRQLTQQLGDLVPVSHRASLVVLPPAIYLPLVQESLQSSVIEWGAQNIYPANEGAFTGELSGPMLKEYGCRYVLVGHSERRHLFHEDENFVAQKFHHVKEHGMIPILCVGEHRDAREKGQTEFVIAQQLQAVVQENKNVFEACIIAYEPVWAIGTGETATPEEAQAVHAFIRHFVATINSQQAELLPILYGGSVNEKNAVGLFNQPDVDGGLIGGASLKAQSFVDILKCINSCY